jgi:hypothetical protein
VRVCATNEPHWPNVTRVRDRCAAHRKNVMINLLVGRPCTAPRTRLSLMQSAGGTCGSMLTTGQVGACRWIASLCASHGKSHDCAVSLSPCRSCPSALPCRLHKHTRWSTDADSSTSCAANAEDVRRSGPSVMNVLVSLAPSSVASFAVVGFCTHTRRHRHRPKQA